MNKKLILLPTFVLILLFAFSMSALSADDVGLQVNSMDISAGSGEGWSYDSDSKTLTITKDATLANADPNTPVTIYVKVTESCNLTLAGVNLVGAGVIDSYESIIRFTNGGTLTLQTSTANILTGSAQAPCDAISTFGALAIKGGGSLKIEGVRQGIYGDVLSAESTPTDISISNATLEADLTERGFTSICTSDGDINITNSNVTYTGGFIIANNGNITIDASQVKGISYGTRNFAVLTALADEQNTDNGNITISGESKVDTSLIVSDVATTSSSDIDIEALGLGASAIIAAGDIIFNGPVEVQADSSQIDFFTFHGILAQGKIEFKLTEGGSVTALGSKENTLEVDEITRTIPAGIGIMSLMPNMEEPPAPPSLSAGEAKITLAEKNVITQPSQGEIISGNITEGTGSQTEIIGTYEAIGKDNAASRISQVQYPKLNTEDHFGYIVGYPDKEFKAANSLTRAECAAMFARLSTGFSEDGEYSSDFKDVPAGSWSAKYIGYLATAGIIKGYEDGTYKPNKSITRAEFTTMTVNFFKWADVADTITFKDVPKTHWAYEAINAAYNFQFVKGYSPERFGPSDNIKRCDAVLLLNRALQRDKPDASFIDGKPAGLITFSDIVKGQTTDEYYYGIMEAANSHDYAKDQDGQETWTKLLN